MRFMKALLDLLVNSLSDKIYNRKCKYRKKCKDYEKYKKCDNDVKKRCEKCKQCSKTTDYYCKKCYEIYENCKCHFECIKGRNNFQMYWA